MDTFSKLLSRHMHATLLECTENILQLRVCIFLDHHKDKPMFILVGMKYYNT